MYEDKDRENMERNDREEQRVNWTTPERLEQGGRKAGGQERPEDQRRPQNDPRSQTFEGRDSWNRCQEGYGGQIPYRQADPSWQERPSYPNERRRKGSGKGRMFRRAAGITAAAVLFGTVSGGVMAGINYVGTRLASAPAAEQVQQTESQVPAQAPQTAAAAQNVSSSVVNDVSAIVEQAMPSIVAIHDTMTIEQRDFFGRSQTYTAQSSGSGIILNKTDTELLIATNNHVVSAASDLSVTFVDDNTVKAAVKGTDSATDLAIIAVQLSDIPSDTMSKIKVAALGDSDNIKVGQQVIAIGNALGYGQSVTVGYVSALDREITDENGIKHTFIQTDAAINPGNSGGALIDLQGNLIGINAAKTASTEVEGMGFAIPISKAQEILNELMTKKTRVAVEEDAQGYLGVQVTNIDAASSKAYGMPIGVYVYKIVEGGAAASSDLKEKDIITKFDGQSVTTMDELTRMLTYYEGGSQVTLTVQSLVNGAYVEHEVSITLGTKPEAENR